MPGSFDLDYLPAAILSDALPIVVFLYDPGGDGYTLLPNIRCLQIDYREGPQPPVARFTYMMDDALNRVLGWPYRFEQVWPIDALGPYIVHTDDRLVVVTQDPNGDPVILFDGFAQVPQVDLHATHQGVTFAAVGTPTRLWDNPITGRVQRDGDHADAQSGNYDRPVSLPARFNPADHAVGTLAGYIANSTAQVTDNGGGDNYPVFLDPGLKERQTADDEYLIEYWYVSDVVTYLLATEPLPEDPAGNPYVVLPSFPSLRSLLNAQYPPTPDGPFDPNTAESADVLVRDYDASNKHLPEVLQEMFSYAGFVMSWQIGQDEYDLPTTTLRLQRRDAAAATTPKRVYLAASGTTELDPSENNTAAFHLARDSNAMVNAIGVETNSNQVEATFLLAPLFQPDSGDTVPAQMKQYDLNNLTTASNLERRKYRWFGIDETGDGYWNGSMQRWITDEGCDLSPLFPDDNDGGQTYCKRYRPGKKTLISRDKDGRPLKHILEINVTGTSGIPAVADVAALGGTWLTISHGWRLLSDRLGIELTVEHPNDWHTGNDKQPSVRVIDWLANPAGAGAKPFALRLTTVIDHDHGLEVLAPKRVGSPSKYEKVRYVDAKDHFLQCTVATGSLYYGQAGGNGADPVPLRDDTDAAETHAKLIRAAHEFPRLAGSVTVPFLTDYYEIGDRIKVIDGRNANLQINVGADQGETPTYPWVVGFSWVLEPDRQQTILQLSDRRAEVINL
jgi:hypothetical protein